MADSDGRTGQRLLLLRHGEVTSHHGDVPVTEPGLATGRHVGRRLGESCSGPIWVMSGDTRRARDTARAVVEGARAAGVEVVERGTAFALRNPDLYLAGVRVNMVSSEAALAEQVPGLPEAAVGKAPFFSEFISAPDRIGWWLRHDSPPGEGAISVAARIRAFAASLADLPEPPPLIVGVAHSPILRACALGATGKDPGEPSWLAGVELLVSPDRAVEVHVLTEAP
jgi:broad specificity phosphatase PhoE